MLWDHEGWRIDRYDKLIYKKRYYISRSPVRIVGGDINYEPSIFTAWLIELLIARLEYML